MRYFAQFILFLVCGSFNSGLAGTDLTDTPVEDAKSDCDATDWQCYPEDCFHVQRKGYKSGVYQVRPLGAPKPYLVFCDLDTNEGDWTVLQHRFNGKVDFYRNFSEYTNGFGEIIGEHWAGLETMHQLTSRRDYELYIELEDFDNNKAFANYKKFAVDSKENGYKLTVGNFSGTAGSSLGSHNGFKFTTFDVDNDIYEHNCAVVFKGAWWYQQCHSSNLNGHYGSGVTEEYATGVVWSTFKGAYYSLKVTKMLMRPIKRSENLNEDLKTVIKQNEEMKEELNVLKKQYENMLERINLIDEGKDYPEDCAYVVGNTSGVYEIKPLGSRESFSVYCDLNFLDQKWTVIQNRFEGKVDFYQNFKDYQNGFGTLEGEHWLGLEKIHRIVHNSDYELYVALTDHENVSKYAQYKDFSICGADDGYRLVAAGYIGTAGDSLSSHSGRKFTTFDKDEDLNDGNCAVGASGAWWYTSCHSSNLNGFYNGTGAAGMSWTSFHGKLVSLKTSKMLIRKKNPIAFKRLMLK